jgi:hypothetical protein
MRDAREGERAGPGVWFAPDGAHLLLSESMYFVRGLAELATRDPVAASESLRRALYIDPSFALAAFQLGRAQNLRGDARAALRAYRRALRTLDPEDTRNAHLLERVNAGGRRRGVQRPFSFGRASCVWAPGVGALEQVAHLLVAHLREVAIPRADGAKLSRRHQADDLVDDATQRRARARRRDRHGDDRASRPLLSDVQRGGQHRRSRGQPVVDQHDRPVGQRQRGTIGSIQALPALQLAPLLAFDRLQLLRGELQARHERLVDDARAAACDCAKGQLFVAGHAELSHHVYVERCAEAARDLIGDRHAAARQAKHQGVAPGARVQLLGEQAARLAAISKCKSSHGLSRSVDARSYPRRQAISTGARATRAARERRATATIKR